LDLTTHTSLSPIRRGFKPGFVNYKKGCTRLAAASDKVYQLLAHGWWFSPASSTTKTGCHDIAEILLKVVLKHKKSIKITLTLRKKGAFLFKFFYFWIYPGSIVITYSIPYINTFKKKSLPTELPISNTHG
jgi:hypothetical protein